MDFIGPRRGLLRALFYGGFAAILISVCNHLGDLLGVGLRSSQLRKVSVSPHDNGVPKWLGISSASAGRLLPCIDRVEGHRVALGICIPIPTARIDWIA